MRTIRLVVLVGILFMSLAEVATAGAIPRPECWCLDDSLHCYNMRRDVMNEWGELGANHTFTMCKDRHGNSSVWEDDWAGPGYSQNNLGNAWVEEDMGCIKIDSLLAAQAETDQGFANACPGYDSCAADNPGYSCQNSYWPPSGCYCFPWQMGFRSRLEHSYVIECPGPGQGGGGSGGGSSDPSDYDYGPYYGDDWPQQEDDGASLWRICMDYCTATSKSRIYLDGEWRDVSTGCIEWNTDCWLEWLYN